MSYQVQAFRLDRLVQLKGALTGESQWRVLDYKSAASPQQQIDLVEKMKTYRAALQAIYPGQSVQAAFLTSDGKVVTVS